MKPFVISALAFHLAVIAPAFADLVPQDFPSNGVLNEFTIMDNVATSAPIVDIKRHHNILQRRDASCDIIYKKVFGASTRKIYVDEIYGATQFCRNDFYQGDLKDWRAQDPLFGDKILPYFRGAIAVDIASNSYFGDTSRVATGSESWSTNVFDGIFKHIKTYIGAGIIPSSQTHAITTNFLNNHQDAYDQLKEMVDSMPVLMRGAFTDSDLLLVIDADWAKAYERYLYETGADNGGYITDIQTGIKTLAFEGIPIQVNHLFKPIAFELNGNQPAHVGLLTVKGNFVFATDKDYGEGEDGKTALEVFYDQKEMQRYYRVFLKAGTQIALPEFVVVAMTEF